MIHQLEYFRLHIREVLAMDATRPFTITELVNMIYGTDARIRTFSRLEFWANMSDQCDKIVNANVEFVIFRMLSGMTLNNIHLDIADRWSVDRILNKYNITSIKATQPYDVAINISNSIGFIEHETKTNKQSFVMYFISPWDFRKLIALESNVLGLCQYSDLLFELESIYNYEHKRALLAYVNALRYPIENTLIENTPNVNKALNEMYIGATMICLNLKNAYGKVRPAIRIFISKGSLHHVLNEMENRIQGTYASNKYLVEVKPHRILLPPTWYAYPNDRIISPLDIYKQLESAKIDKFNTDNYDAIAKNKCGKMYSKRFPVTFNKLYVTYFPNEFFTLKDIRGIIIESIHSAQIYDVILSDKLHMFIAENNDFYTDELNRASLDEKIVIGMMNDLSTDESIYSCV